MRIHKRERLCMSAESELRSALLAIDSKFELTRFEFIQLLQNVLGGEILQTCKYAIRTERHGNTDTPGGAESDE